MAKTKEEILQKVNELCKSKNLNLTEKFKEKFAEKNVSKFDGEEVDENVMFETFEFVLESAYHAQSTALAEEATRLKEATLIEKKKEIKPKEKETQTFELPDEIRELAEYAREQKAKEAIAIKRKSVYDLATKNLQEDEKKRFETFFGTQTVSIDADDTVVSQSMIESYTQFKKEFVGSDMAPLASGGKGKTMEEEFSDIPITKI